MHACTQQACINVIHVSNIIRAMLFCWSFLDVSDIFDMSVKMLEALLRMPSGLFISLEWDLELAIQLFIYIIFSFICCILFCFIWYVFHFPHLHKFRCLCCFFWKICFYYYEKMQCRKGKVCSLPIIKIRLLKYIFVKKNVWPQVLHLKVIRHFTVLLSLIYCSEKKKK